MTAGHYVCVFPTSNGHLYILINDIDRLLLIDSRSIYFWRHFLALFGNVQWLVVKDFNRSLILCGLTDKPTNKLASYSKCSSISPLLYSLIGFQENEPNMKIIYGILLPILSVIVLISNGVVILVLNEQKTVSWDCFHGVCTSTFHSRRAAKRICRLGRGSCTENNSRPPLSVSVSLTISPRGWQLGDKSLTRTTGIWCYR